MRELNDVKLNDCGFLFDLDGVLIDSEKEYTKIWSEIHRRFPTSFPDMPLRIKGMTLNEIIATYYPDPETGSQVRNLLHRLESNMHYEWLPGAKELLIDLRKNKCPVALVTSSDNKKMAHLHQELPDLESLFDIIISGNMVQKSKPNPEGYLKAADMINKSPRNCFVFEDSLQGVMAGKASGATVIGISGTLPVAKISPYSDMVIEGFSNLDLNALLLLKSSGTKPASGNQ